MAVRAVVTGQGNDVSLGEDSAFIVETSPVSTALFVVRGTISMPRQKHDTGCNESGGFTSQVGLRRQLKIDCSLQWRSDMNCMTSAPAFTSGEDALWSIKIIPDAVREPGLFFYLPTAYIDDCSIDIDGVAGIDYKVTILNQGAFSQPGEVEAV